VVAEIALSVWCVAGGRDPDLRGFLTLAKYRLAFNTDRVLMVGAIATQALR